MLRLPHPDPRPPTTNHRSLFALSLLALATVLTAGERPPVVDVIPQPRHVTYERGRFAVDAHCVVQVSEQATAATRRAARVVQLGLRDRFGIDVPIVRLAERAELTVSRPIWVVEPRLKRQPARTIGVEGLEFTDEMRAGGYFIRVEALLDPVAVLHGADDAGSLHAAQTFLQLIRPAVKGGLFRKGRGPSVPALWLRDWPSQAIRPIPPPYGPEGATGVGADAVERLIELGARYKLNALPEHLLAAVPDSAARLRELAGRHGIRVVEQAPPLANSPLLTALIGGAADPLRLRVAVQAEAAWGPPDPDAETFRRRLALDAARHPGRSRDGQPPRRPGELLDRPDEDDRTEAHPPTPAGDRHGE